MSSSSMSDKPSLQVPTYQRSVCVFSSQPVTWHPSPPTRPTANRRVLVCSNPVRDRTPCCNGLFSFRAPPLDIVLYGRFCFRFAPGAISQGVTVSVYRSQSGRPLTKRTSNIHDRTHGTVLVSCRMPANKHRYSIADCTYMTLLPKGRASTV